MPIAYRVDAARRCILTVAEGTLTDAELLDHARRIESDPQTDPSFDEVVDISAVRGFGPSTETVRSAADVLRTGKRPGKSGRIAIVAPSDAGFGVGRMFEAFSGEGEHRVRTFRSREEALAWLEQAPSPSGRAAAPGG